MNWGKATIVILLAFIAFIGTMSYFMFRSPRDEYDHQYYEDGLSFDRDYNREAQVAKDRAKPIVKINADSVWFVFPQPVSGTVKFIRPSSDAKDKTYALFGKRTAIPIAQMTEGQWQLIVEWTGNNKAYLYKQEVYLK